MPSDERGDVGDGDGAVELEITDVLDLHSFPPREVPDLVRDYLDAAYDKGLRELRIIHGRGVGVQRRTVRTLLERDPRVVDFRDAPGEHGGWGATVVTLRVSALGVAQAQQEQRGALGRLDDRRQGDPLLRRVGPFPFRPEPGEGVGVGRGEGDVGRAAL